ncbi:hypothetical protein N7474_005373 [Penicillium riverlandense]|uniref:uncharacterized protein n=1 Tax=Penicillium riverlandense TaxID=1903569 RepID=UPI0025478BB1|nr:uncharacterized protein N7474_005373 [Penicillium riverlandense]KAJ5819782.1 hypothetical protein N7474_005373 [Penicillium riverlandense]
MTSQTVFPSSEPWYSRRGDRVNEEPSAKNAQGLFPPDACIFVGNLSTKLSAEEQSDYLSRAFWKIGPCYVKIKQDKKKGLPGAFVQFEYVEHAATALQWDELLKLDGRWLRIERAKGRRTACLGFRSGESISNAEVDNALNGRGPVELYTLERYQSGPYSWCTVCRVTFAYVDDCRDAIRHFQKDETYYMVLLDIDGNPRAKQSNKSAQDLKKKNWAPPPPFPPGLSGNKPPRFNNNRPYRNGPNNPRGYNGPPPPIYNENMPPGGPYPPYGPPLHPQMYPGMPLYPPNVPPPMHPPVSYPAVYPPASGCGPASPYYYYPPPGPMYNPGPPIASSLPDMNGGAMIVNSQPMPVSMPPPPYCDPYAPDMGYPPYPPPYTMPGPADGYYMLAMSPEGYGPSMEYRFAPSGNNDTSSEKTNGGTPPEASEKDTEKDKTDEPEVDIYNLPPEKAPRLIKTHNSDSNSNSDSSDAEEQKQEQEEKEDRPSRREKRPKKFTVLDTVVEETECLPHSSSESEVSHSPSFSFSPSPPLNESRNHSSEPTSSPDPTNPHLQRKGLASKYQPASGITVEEYVRNEAKTKAAWADLSEELIAQVIGELEEERVDDKKVAQSLITASAGTSRSCSLTRTASSKSI